MEVIIPKDFNEMKQILDNTISGLIKLKDELMNNKDNPKKLSRLIDDLENLQGDLDSVKVFLMAQLYLNSEYNDE